MENEIKDWLNKQGYPLEMQVAIELQKNGFNIIQSDFYKDTDTGESREIDVVGFKQVSIGNMVIRLTIVIECKSGKGKPWLLFSSKNSTLSDVDKIIQTPCSKFGKVLLNALATKKHYKNFEIFSIGEKTSYGVTECFSNGKDIPYKAMMSAAKAVASKCSFESNFKQNEICDIIFPFVIIEAPLFESYFKDELILNKINSGTLAWRNRLIDYPHTIIKIQQFECFKNNLAKYSKEFDMILNDALNNIIPNRKSELDRLRPRHEIR